MVSIEYSECIGKIVTNNLLNWKVSLSFLSPNETFCLPFVNHNFYVSNLTVAGSAVDDDLMTSTPEKEEICNLNFFDTDDEDMSALGDAVFKETG